MLDVQLPEDAGSIVGMSGPPPAPLPAFDRVSVDATVGRELMQSVQDIVVGVDVCVELRGGSVIIDVGSASMDAHVQASEYGGLHIN